MGSGESSERFALFNFFLKYSRLLPYSADTTVVRQSKLQIPKLPPFISLVDSVHLAESKLHPEFEAVHDFEVRLVSSLVILVHFIYVFQVIIEPASYTPQKYALFKRYQEEIHHDKKSSPSGFERFLVESPLQVGAEISVPLMF